MSGRDSSRSRELLSRKAPPGSKNPPSPPCRASPATRRWRPIGTRPEPGLSTSHRAFICCLVFSNASIKATQCCGGGIASAAFSFCPVRRRPGRQAALGARRGQDPRIRRCEGRDLQGAEPGARRSPPVRPAAAVPQRRSVDAASVLLLHSLHPFRRGQPCKTLRVAITWGGRRIKLKGSIRPIYSSAISAAPKQRVVLAWC